MRDVTVLDGTEMGPSTLYTKVWRMRNSGTTPWPANTRVMHTGGKRMPMGMADTNSVALKVRLDPILMLVCSSQVARWPGDQVVRR